MSAVANPSIAPLPEAEAPPKTPVDIKTGEIAAHETFDPAAIQARYLAERDARLARRPEGVEQYTLLDGSLLKCMFTLPFNHLFENVEAVLHVCLDL